MQPDSPLSKLMDSVAEAKKWVDKIIKMLRNVASEIKEYLGQETYKWVLQKLDQLDKSAAKFFKKVYKALEYIGNSIHINDVADQWEKVAKIIGNPEDEKQGELKAYFGGQAAEAYFAAEENQLKSLTSLYNKSGKIKDSLTKAADGIDNAHTAMSAGFMALVIAVAGSAPAVPPVVTAPAALGVSGVALASCILAFGYALYALNKDLKDVKKDLTGIEFSGWNTLDPNTDMSDGSVSDGDGSGWKYRRV